MRPTRQAGKSFRYCTNFFILICRRFQETEGRTTTIFAYFYFILFFYGDTTGVSVVHGGFSFFAKRNRRNEEFFICVLSPCYIAASHTSALTNTETRWRLLQCMYRCTRYFSAEWIYIQSFAAGTFSFFLRGRKVWVYIQRPFSVQSLRRRGFVIHWHTYRIPNGKVWINQAVPRVCRRSHFFTLKQQEDGLKRSKAAPE